MILGQPVVYELERIAVPTVLMIGQKDTTAIGKDRAPPEAAKTLGNYPELGRLAHAAHQGLGAGAVCRARPLAAGAGPRPLQQGAHRAACPVVAKSAASVRPAFRI